MDCMILSELYGNYVIARAENVMDEARAASGYDLLAELRRALRS